MMIHRIATRESMHFEFCVSAAFRGVRKTNENQGKKRKERKHWCTEAYSSLQEKSSTILFIFKKIIRRTTPIFILDSSFEDR